MMWWTSLVDMTMMTVGHTSHVGLGQQVLVPTVGEPVRFTTDQWEQRVSDQPEVGINQPDTKSLGLRNAVPHSAKPCRKSRHFRVEHLSTAAGSVTHQAFGSAGADTALALAFVGWSQELYGLGFGLCCAFRRDHVTWLERRVKPGHFIMSLRCVIRSSFQAKIKEQ